MLFMGLCSSNVYTNMCSLRDQVRFVPATTDVIIKCSYNKPIKYTFKLSAHFRPDNVAQID
ncbi:hypothetical protein KXD40_001459 [Peronospora effusa]|uniref:Uncharacterized protein n=1 Tax=Peronospora effusa TaxID=542832 RepID=A0A3M6VP61_9STRA|nr:hypothetical protein DD238_001390 [Peronospora effusa]UIZ20635.1 hypothetical protein KXD40_001459 [Peronospora effusa]